MNRVGFCLAVLLLVATPSLGQGKLAPPAPKHIVAMGYPRLAHLAGIQGKVVLEVNVATDGTAKAIKTILGPPLLAEYAMESLRRWRFTEAALAAIKPSQGQPTKSSRAANNVAVSSTECDSDSRPCLIRLNFVFILEGSLCDIEGCPQDFEVDLPDTITVSSRPARAIIN